MLGNNLGQVTDPGKKVARNDFPEINESLIYGTRTKKISPELTKTYALKTISICWSKVDKTPKYFSNQVMGIA